MFKNHPKGLFVAFFANMGERFGYYTMLAILVLFIQAKYGLDAAAAGVVYTTFASFVYFLPLLGGLAADRLLGYGRSIKIGMVVMFVGYLMLALPTSASSGKVLLYAAMAVIAIGTGLFKGNLQALVGNMYDDPKYSGVRDQAFNIFYMGINIGAMFAPTAASAISGWVLKSSHFFYDARIPGLANAMLKGAAINANEYLTIAQAQDASVTLSTLPQFSEKYISVLSKSYHFGFGLACISLIFSMAVFWLFRKLYASADMTERQKAKSDAHKDQIVPLTPQQTRERMVALGMVFLVVIFFWMAFQQNGLTMTYFARDYTRLIAGKFTNLWFDLVGLLSIFFAVISFVYLVKKSSSLKTRLIAGLSTIGFTILALLRFASYSRTTHLSPEIFQQFNPFFIVALTPLVVGIFAMLNRRGKEPSAPRKIGFGMLIVAIGFALLVIASLGLPSPKALHGLVAPANMLVSPYWLIWSYFIQTIAELFLSPMGISFVSRVAPPKYKGLMQGGWFASTAIGIYAINIIGFMWNKLPLWTLWFIVVVCCVLSAAFMFFIMKRLENATK